MSSPILAHGPMRRLTSDSRRQQADDRQLDAAITTTLEGMGFDG
jgi:hypothetical protein